MDKFGERKIKTMKKIAEEGRKKFLLVPVGDKVTVVPTMDITMNPAIRYQQNEDSICGFASLASSLHYLSRFKESEALMTYCDEFYAAGKDFHKILQCIIAFIQSSKEFKGLRKVYRIKRLKRGHDILGDGPKENEMMVVILHQSDNHQSHAVALCNNYIFNCNAPNALPLSKEGLDCCCGETANFDYVFDAYHFVIKH